MTLLGKEDGFLEVEPHDPRDRRPDRAVVLLLHGLGGSKDDWRLPVARDWHYDLSHSPPDRHDDNHLHPPVPLGIPFFDEFGLSPKRTDVRSWTEFLKALGHTVVNYDQDGKQETVDVPLAQLEERIVPFLRSDVLTGRLAGKRMVVLCHSRGGILVRRYMNSNPVEASAWISRVITLCSPHQGTRAPGAAERLANAGTVLGSGIGLTGSSVVANLLLRIHDVLGATDGAKQLEPGNPLFADLAAPGDVPGIEFRTFGGTSVSYVRMYAFFYTPGSFVPNLLDFPDFRYDWTSIPFELLPVSPLMDRIPDSLVEDEQVEGKGDGLVADSKAQMIGAPHESFPINHLEALFDERLFARVADLLAGGLIVEPSHVTFSVPVGKTATSTVRIENTSNDRVTVQLTASPTGVFEWEAVNTEIAPGEGVTVTFRFHRADQTIRTEQVRITSTASNSPHTIGLTGKGPGGVPPPSDPPLPTRLTYSTTSLNFGGAAVGEEETEELVIRNNTGRTVRVQIAGSAVGAVFRWPAIDMLLAGNGSEHRVTVTFKPPAIQVFERSLVVESDTAISPETIKLRGKGSTRPAPPIEE